MKKLFNLDRVALEQGLHEVAAAAGTLNATSVDTQNFNQAIFHQEVIATGAVDYTISVEHSDDNSAFEDAGLDEVTGSLTDEIAVHDFEVQVKSLKRYVRVTVVTTGAGTADIVAIYALGDKDYIPSATEFLNN